MASARATPVLAMAASAAFALSASAPSSTPSSGEAATGDMPLPPAGGEFDYQLGGAYDPPAGVEVVARDRTASPADGVYSICYVNGFQTQPGELALWPDDLLLRGDDGAPLYDPDWPDEAIVDTRRADDVARIVVPWIRGCADAGFDAVEFDNLDTYTRTGGSLNLDDNLALARLLVQAAHAEGLATGQKNAAEDAALLRDEAGFDFAVVEECTVFDECNAYTAVYGAHVLAIEYPDTLDTPFTEACTDADRPASLILRDRHLVTPDDPAYVYESC
ncbi:MAG: endo alpha-1,4 polygalactosaminidase [Microbacterium sp.]|uniref:endo alpha-1,4 polygalactosaminidase n=1 Tax=Microbacterium sp. TaxID=51671 RepID=UPI0019CC16B7|nr:endo alpha-1,4 polygalactosaminidase [Microbacterium sp.]MBD3756809.1 endo alpha-1,4 polygalactosaminidase [Microbacterium sp.]